MDKILVLSHDQIVNTNIKRLIQNYSLEFTSKEINVNLIQQLLKQYYPKILVVHHSVKCHNISILFDYLVTNKIIPVIYINKVSNFGNFYNVVNDLYFMNIEEMKLGSLLEFGVSFLMKCSEQYAQLNKKVEKLENKLEEEKLVVKAKFKLMNEESMSEEEAYKFILKQSMDQRVSKAIIAKEILKN